MTENRSNANEPGCMGWGPVCEDNDLRKRLIAFARRWLPEGEKDDAEDTVQTACVRVFVYTVPSRIEDRANYLFRTVKRLCYDRAFSPSRLTAANTVQLDAPQSEEHEEAFMELSDPGRGPEVDAITKVENDCLSARIRAQSEDFTEREQRLLQWHLDGLSNEQIAHVLGDDIKAVRSDVNAVMSKIRYRLTHW